MDDLCFWNPAGWCCFCVTRPSGSFRSDRVYALSQVIVSLFDLIYPLFLNFLNWLPLVDRDIVSSYHRGSTRSPSTVGV